MTAAVRSAVRVIAGSLAVVATALAVPAVAAVSSANPDGVVPAVSSSAVVSTTEARGAGFVVAPGRLVTAAHVVKGAAAVQLAFGDGSKAPGEVIRKDDGLDLALVAFEATVAPIRLVASIPIAGSRVSIVGAPTATLTVSQGSMIGTATIDGLTYLEIDAATNHGNSGGPLVAEDGDVIGVVVARESYGAKSGIVVPADRVTAFVRQTGGGSSSDRQPTASNSSVGTDVRVAVALLVLAVVASVGVGLAAVVRSRRRRRRRIIVTVGDLTSYGRTSGEDLEWHRSTSN